MARNTALVPVVLEAVEEELFRRVQNRDRVGKKLSSTDELQRYMRLDTIQMPDVLELLVLDVTYSSPEESALRIMDSVATMQSSLRPASQRHLQMKATSP